MKNSVVGFFSVEMSFNQVCEEFILGGLNMVKVRYLGDNMALLTPNQGDKMEDIIRLNKQWFKSVFEVIEPWSEEHIAGHKIIWVRCYGLPMSLWNMDCFSKMVGEVASLVDIDRATETWDNLEYARLQVRTLKSGSAKITKGMKINGQILNIYIEEEKPNFFEGKCKCVYNHYASSDSVTSSESSMEGTNFSVKSVD